MECVRLGVSDGVCDWVWTTGCGQRSVGDRVYNAHFIDYTQSLTLRRGGGDRLGVDDWV